MNFGLIFSTKWLDALRQRRVGEIVQVVHQERFDSQPTTSMTRSAPPSITEGVELFNIDYTPRKIGNKIIVTALSSGYETSNIDNAYVIAIFKDNEAQASAANAGIDGTSSATALNSGEALIKKAYIADSLNINFKIRGGIAGVGTGFTNQKRDYGVIVYNFGQTVMPSWVEIIEIEQ